MDTIFRKYEQPLKGGKLLPLLIHIRGHKCEKCQLTEWLDNPITLQVHHKDGDRTNNELNNLELLCPNCHSYTDNFGSKNKKDKKNISDEEFIEALKKEKNIRQALFSLGLSDAGVNYQRARKLINDNHLYKSKENQCPICGKSILPTSKMCLDCYNKQQQSHRPARQELKNLIRTLPFTEIGNKYSVSDNAVRNWCKTENLPYTKKEIKAISDKDWELL